MRREAKTNISRHSERPKKAWQSLIIAVMLCFVFSMPAAASYLPFNTNVNMNVGIGTSTPQGAFVVTNGNVGIGTWAPGLMLDVKGTARMTGLTLTGNGAANGNVLVGNSVGVGTWMPASTLLAGSGTNYWLLNGGAGNVGINTSYAVGIGTSFVGGPSEAALSVMNGDVGIGTWVPSVNLDVKGNIMAENGNVRSGGFGNFASADTIVFNDGSSGVNVETNSLSRMYVTLAGNVGIGTITPAGGLVVMNGNVGIGTVVPNQALYVNGNMIINSAIYSTNQLAYFSLQSNNEFLVAPNITLGNSSDTDAAINLVGSVAIGTINYQNTLPDGALIVEPTAGNVGIGTWTADGGNLIVNGGGNVGISTAWPGQALDVHGTVRMTGLTLTGNGAANGNVLVGNSIGVGTWMPASTLLASGGSNYWLNDTTGNVGISTTYAVGVGTTFVGGTGEAALSVMNGNVGIGTWVPAASLDVKGQSRFVSGFEVTGIAADNFNSVSMSWDSTYGGEIQSYANMPLILNALGNNVGIGSLTPGQRLDVQGTVRAIGFTMSGQTPVSGYVLTASDSNGDTTWSPSSSVGTNYWLNNSGGNVGISTIYTVGIGTTFVGGTGEAALSVMNGNVGIGTWVPKYSLDILGNVGIGTKASGDALIVNTSGVGIGTFSPIDNFQVFSNNGNGTEATIGSISKYAVLCIDSIHGNCIGGDYLQLDQLVSGQMDIYYNGTGDLNFHDNSSAVRVIFKQGGNVGIGTSTPFSLLGILGNVAIGKTAGDAFLTTTAPSGGMIVEGNIGIGSLIPSQALDVTGTVRAIGLTMSGQTPISGYVLTASDSNGDTTWSPSSSVGTNYWLNDITGNVGISTTYAVGIGTTFVGGTGEAALSVMNGNVGIGTWVPTAKLSIVDSFSGTAKTVLVIGATGGATGTDIGMQFQEAGFPGQDGAGIRAVDDGGSNMSLRFDTDFANTLVPNQMVILGSGNVGIGTVNPFGGKLIIPSGNVGIGSLAPGQLLDVQGTARMTGFALTGNGAAAGNVLVSNTIGVGTWMPTTTLPVGTLTSGTTNQVAYYSGALTLSSNSSMVFNAPNVGLGTVTPLATLQVVGNIGIGTVKNGDNFISTAPPNGGFIVEGNVGVGSWAPGQKLDVQGTVRSIGQIVNGNVGIGTSFINGAGEAALSIMNGNVGIGTWLPRAVLDVEGTLSIVYFGGNVGIGTGAPATTLDISAPGGAAENFEDTNLTIPNYSTFDSPPVTTHTYASIQANGGTQGGLQLMGFTSSTLNTYPPVTIYGTFGNTNTDGGTAILFVGDKTDGGTATQNLANSDVMAQFYNGSAALMTILGSGNVGIGTITPTGGLTVMNGNVGIGTWVPGSALQVNNTFTFQNENNIGSQAGAFTVNWTQGNKQKVTLTGSGAHTVTFTAPTSGVSNLMLKVVQGSASNTVTWPAAVKWPSASTPTLTTVNGQEDLMNCYWDGTDYLCTAALNYTP